MLGCGEVRHPGGMVEGGSSLEGILRVRAIGLHGGASLLRITLSVEPSVGGPRAVLRVSSLPPS